MAKGTRQWRISQSSPPFLPSSLSLPAPATLATGLLGLQLLVTAGVTALFVFNASLKNYVLAAQWPFWTAFAVSLVLIIALGCSEDLRRRHPVNLVALGAFTLCESVLVGTVSAMYDTRVVLLAVGITSGAPGGRGKGCRVLERRFGV